MISKTFAYPKTITILTFFSSTDALEAGSSATEGAGSFSISAGGGSSSGAAPCCCKLAVSMVRE